MALASDKDEDLYKATREDQISYAVTYGEFLYQAGSWDYPRRVVFKIEKPYGQLRHDILCAFFEIRKLVKMFCISIGLKTELLTKDLD